MGFRPTELVVHHSASLFGDVATLRQWHLARGFADIGYHAVILNGHRAAHDAYNADLDGHISAGRPETQEGAHCQARHMNSKALGVCLVGDSMQQAFSARQLDALVHWLATKCRQYGIRVERISQHSDHDPGKPYCAGLDLQMIRRRVAAHAGGQRGR